jgi:hypothetical protein
VNSLVGKAILDCFLSQSIEHGVTESWHYNHRVSDVHVDVRSTETTSNLSSLFKDNSERMKPIHGILSRDQLNKMYKQVDINTNINIKWNEITNNHVFALSLRSDSKKSDCVHCQAVKQGVKQEVSECFVDHQYNADEIHSCIAH